MANRNFFALASLQRCSRFKPGKGGTPGSSFPPEHVSHMTDTAQSISHARQDQKAFIAHQPQTDLAAQATVSTTWEAAVAAYRAAKVRSDATLDAASKANQDANAEAPRPACLTYVFSINGECGDTWHGEEGSIAERFPVSGGPQNKCKADYVLTAFRTWKTALAAANDRHGSDALWRLNGEAEDEEVAAVRVLLATPAPDLGGMALKLSLVGRVYEQAVDFAEKPDSVGLILDQPDSYGCSAPLLSIYLDALRLSGGPAVADQIVIAGKAAYAASLDPDGPVFLAA